MILHALALLPALLLAPGQDPPKKEQPVIHVPLPQIANDPHQQMEKLIGEVELRLRQIDKLLADASAAQRPSSGVARTAELVKRSQQQGKQVVEAIDKILELADHTDPGPPGHGS